MKISDALDAFILSCRADGLSDKTTTWYLAMLRPMLHALDGLSLDDVTAADLRQYIVELRGRTTRYGGAQRPQQRGGLSPESVSAHIRALHRFWRWCSDEYDIDNPAKRIKHPGKGKQTPKGISPVDMSAMLHAAIQNEDSIVAARDVAMIALLADSGCRAGGLLSLTSKDVDLEARTAIVREKGDRLRRIFFLPFTALALARWEALRPDCEEKRLFLSFNNGEVRGALSYTGLYQALRRVAARAGVERFNPHSFRHAFARQYLLNGGDLASLAQLLGHTDVTTTAHFYALFEQSQLAQQHNKFSPMRGQE